ncbi:hypothetical protein JXA32_01190 [Candidatus Sumerlaeota bacterium]|nr:hypothetical protein [Candidatus Sumerlaeota bacterium]
MRNGLLLAVGVLTLALLPAVSYASAPIFIDVPGVVILNQDGGTTMSAVNVFVFDDSVYDPDTDVADLAWSFVETDETLTVDPLPGANIFSSVTGIGAVADTTAARNLTSASAENLAADANFSLMVSKSTTGQSASAVAMAAGTVQEATVSDDLFTTIIIAVTDSVNATYKTVLVKSNYTTPYADNSGGLYEQITTHSPTNANAGTVLGYLGQYGNGTIVSSASGASGVTINSSGASLVYSTSLGGFTGAWGFAYWTTAAGSALAFNVEEGYVYRLRVTATLSGASTSNNMGNIRLRMMTTDSGFVSEFVMERDGSGSDPLSPIGGAKTYECLVEPPQNARLDTTAYNCDFNYYLDYMPLFSTHTGDITYSDITLDRFPIPEDFSNGAIYYADTLEQFETFTTAGGTTESAPIAFGIEGPAYDSNHGWRIAPRALTEFSILETTYYMLYEDHTDYNVAQGGAGTSVNDNITTVRVGANATEGTIEVYSIGTHATYLGAYTEMYIGYSPSSVAAADNSFSLVPGTLLDACLDNVYYRCKISVKLGTADNAGEQSQFYIRLGNPNSNFNGNLTVNEYWESAAPSPTEYTDYTAWVRGMSVNNGKAHNMSIKVQILDTNVIGYYLTEGTTVIDTVSLEMFPVAFFE